MYKVDYTIRLDSIKVPKYLECVFECSKEHSEKKTRSKKRSTN